MAGKVGKESLLSLTNVNAMRQLVVSNRHWVCLQNVIGNKRGRPTIVRQKNMTSMSTTKTILLSLIFFSFIPKDSQQTLVIGKYIISSPSISFEEITINKNNSFHKHISGCNGATDDKGKWTRFGDTLITTATLRSVLFAGTKKQYEPTTATTPNTINKYLIKKDTLFYLSKDPDNGTLVIVTTLVRKHKK